jgi:hypothetical protein
MTSKSFGMHHKVCNVLMHKPPPLLVIHEARADTYATTWYTNHNTTLNPEIGWILRSPPTCWNCDDSL